MNTSAPSPTLQQVAVRVLEIQAGLHRWANDGPSHEPVESRMLGDGHVRFGERPGETHPQKRGQGAPGRLNNEHRPHRSLDQQPPSPCDARDDPPDTPKFSLEIVRTTTRCDGLINEYKTAA